MTPYFSRCKIELVARLAWGKKRYIDLDRHAFNFKTMRSKWTADAQACRFNSISNSERRDREEWSRYFCTEKSPFLLWIRIAAKVWMKLLCRHLLLHGTLTWLWPYGASDSDNLCRIPASSRSLLHCLWWKYCLESLTLRQFDLTICPKSGLKKASRCSTVAKW